MSTVAHNPSQDEKGSKIRIPKQDRAVKAKQAILAAAMELFSEKGFHQTNSKEIAAAAGVSIGTFYSYYPGKGELFKEAVQLYNTRFADEFYGLLQDFVPAVADVASRRKVLRDLIGALINAHRVYEGFHDELIVMYLSDTELHEMVTQKQRESREIILGYLKRAPGLAIKDLEAATVVLYDMVHAVVDSVVFKKTELEGERILQSLVEAMDCFLFGRRD